MEIKERIEQLEKELHYLKAMVNLKEIEPFEVNNISTDNLIFIGEGLAPDALKKKCLMFKTEKFITQQYQQYTVLIPR